MVIQRRHHNVVAFVLLPLVFLFFIGPLLNVGKFIDEGSSKNGRVVVGKEGVGGSFFVNADEFVDEDDENEVMDEDGEDDGFADDDDLYDDDDDGEIELPPMRGGGSPLKPGQMNVFVQFCSS